MRVKDVMRKKFVYFQTDDRLKYILKVFAKNGVTSAPVFDDMDFIGIVDTNTIVKYFMPKKFLFIWRKSEDVQLDKLCNITAVDLVKRNHIVLSPDQKLTDILGKIASDIDCIPVVDKNRTIVGVVRNEDITGFLLQKFAESECSIEKEKTKAGVGTEIDQVLAIVKQNEWISAKDIAKELGVTVKSVERMGEVLQDHNLIKMRYSFLGGAQLGSIETEAVKMRPVPKKEKPVKASEKKKKGGKK